MARTKRNYPKSSRIIRVVNPNNSQKSQKSQTNTNTPNNNSRGSRFRLIDHDEDVLLGINHPDEHIHENESIIRPYNLSNVMDSISEEGSGDDSDWTEVPRRAHSSDSETSTVRPLQLTSEDVDSELNFWSTALYCYVLGANPPFKVIDGFIKRIWGYTGYDKISFNSNGTFLVRFPSEEMKTRVLQAGPIFFDNKPVVVKEWTPDVKMVKEAIDVVPIWIRFYGLPLKFWGNALMKIASLVGKPVRCDSNTLLKTFLGHARIMVEVKIGDALPDVIQFADELDNMHRQIVHYEWKPVLCSDCKVLGHIARDCRKRKGPVQGKKMWVPKKVLVPPPPPAVDTVVVGTSGPVVAQPSAVPRMEGLGGSSPNSQGKGVSLGVAEKLSLRCWSIQFSIGESLRGIWNVVPQGLRMGSFGFWNVRGINSENKQSDVRWFLHYNNIGVFGLLETRVKSPSINKVHGGIGSQWSLVHNNDSHPGGRIWVIWDAVNYNVDVVRCEAQVIHTKVTFLPTGKEWWLSVVYGFNRVHERLPLWASINNMRQFVEGPWMVMGDFNNVLAMCERLGAEVINYEMKDFQECVATCGLMDIPATGAFFTWTNKHEPGELVLSRIDRVLITDEWFQEFPDTTTVFHPEGLFDHCPCIINQSSVMERKKGCFRYFNMWGKDPEFLMTVQEVWGRHLYGYKMFQLVKKLKMLKYPLKKLNGTAFANIETSATVARMHLTHVQRKLQSDPTNLEVQHEVHLAAQCYKTMEEARRSFLA
ncbi:uncharacterized protein LOC141620522 [Silene latifolia]|uniref:uncharacterized protein LOC141620522 n=1 Tax=Silene latifolia TaxID=37657 RepID=UPI003D76BEB0